MRDVPQINPKSAEMAERRNKSALESGEHYNSVHQRLHSQTLMKEELAKKCEMDLIEEAARKQEFMLQTF